MDIQNHEASDIVIKISQEQTALVLSAQGSLIYQTIQSAKEQIAEIPTDCEGYILDVRGITKIDSTGFGLILNLIKRIPNNIRLRVIITDPFIKELFKVTKVDILVDLFDDLKDALV